jgi:signal transduction histidine kinase
VTRVVSDPVEPSIGAIVLLDIVRVTIPLAIAASLVRGRRARTRVADVVLSLDDHGVVGGSAVLRRALADPSVRLLRWSPERECYLDAHGAEASMPQAGERLAATIIERDGTPLGAIVHDAALLEEPELLRAVAAAARLALHNERLAEEVRARLEDVQASRQRIVAAGDTERRRLERDLHDGAQQRLVALALRLRTLERATGASGNIRLADDLELLASELDTTIAEVRELARGIRPPALGEAGLGAALEALADRTPLPMRVDARLVRRLPDVVEAAAYFAASEAVANALKHAGAEHIRIGATDDGERLVLIVADDGGGGAQPRAGGGLVGLADRLEALGGELVIDSAHGGGTTLTAIIPLDAAARGDQAAGAARR